MKVDGDGDGLSLLDIHPLIHSLIHPAFIYLPLGQPWHLGLQSCHKLKYA